MNKKITHDKQLYYRLVEKLVIQSKPELTGKFTALNIWPEVEYGFYYGKLAVNIANYIINHNWD